MAALKLDACAGYPINQFETNRELSLICVRGTDLTLMSCLITCKVAFGMTCVILQWVLCAAFPAAKTNFHVFPEYLQISKRSVSCMEFVGTNGSIHR